MELRHLQSETAGTSGKLPNIIIDEFQIKKNKAREIKQDMKLRHQSETTTGKLPNN
ncbi:hypothetical protein DICPUDRAFT_159652, partial [Dictyostelium purpureum]